MIFKERDTQRQDQLAVKFLDPIRKTGARRTSLPVRQQRLVLAGGVSAKLFAKFQAIHHW